MAKIIIVGDCFVGKSSLLLRFTDNSFSESKVTVLGGEFKSKNISIDNQKINFNIWDTAGQERFGSVTTAYYRGTNGVMIVFDLSQRESFDNLSDWIKETSHSCRGASKILVGNKSDLDDKRQIEQDEINEFAEKIGIKYFETSAATGENVENAFIELGRLIVKDNDFKENKNIIDDVNPLTTKQKKGFCNI